MCQSIDKISLGFYNFITEPSAVRSSPNTNAPTIPGGDTMYTNMANLQQTMLLQQRMFLQALCQQNSLVKNANQTNNDPQNDASKKHFIAPSLSQYRFVSGQQVNLCFCVFSFVFFSEYNAENLKRIG